MPVTTAQSDQKPRRGRGWLILLFLPLALVLCLLVVPIVHPVRVQVGGTVVTAELDQSRWYPGFHADDSDWRGYFLPRDDTVPWVCRGGGHAWSFGVRNWAYVVAWFKGE